MRRWRWAVAAVALATRVEGQDFVDPEVANAAEARPTVSAAVGRALAERFVACATTEGDPLTADDRALIGDSVAPLADAVARALGAADCTAHGGEEHCVEVVRAADCDALARALTDAPAALSAAPVPA